jgi:hypothetical protein
MRERFKEWMSGAKGREAPAYADGAVATRCCWPWRCCWAPSLRPGRAEGQLPSPLLCSVGGGAGNNQRHARQRDCRRPCGQSTSILTNTNNFLQTTVWPPQAIAQALGMAGQIQGFYAQIRAILQIPIATATLPKSEAA